MPEKSVLSEETQRRISRMSAQHSFGPSALTKLAAFIGIAMLTVMIWSSFPKSESRKTAYVAPVIMAPPLPVVVTEVDAGTVEPETVDAGVIIEDGRLAKHLAELAKKSEEVHQKACSSLPNVSIEVMQKDRILFAKYGFDLKLALDFEAEKSRIDPNADKFLRSRTAEVILIRRLCGQLERAQDPLFADSVEKTRKTLASLRLYVQ